MARTNRFRTLALRIAIPALLGPALCGAVRAPAQYADNLVSEHIVVRMAREREWIGRDAVPDLERCWQFIERAIAGKLPRRVFVAADWRRPLAWTRAGEDTVFIGMDDPAAVADPRGYLLFHAAREMARMALSKLSGGGAAREENAFLVEGMIEIHAHEFRGSARWIEAAWTLSHLLERTEGLGLSRMYRWQEYSAGRRDPCVTGPAVTFLLVCRQRHGREKLLRLFEALRKATPAEPSARSCRRRRSSSSRHGSRKCGATTPGANYWRVPGRMRRRCGAPRPIPNAPGRARPCACRFP